MRSLKEKFRFSAKKQNSIQREIKTPTTPQQRAHTPSIHCLKDNNKTTSRVN